MIKTAVIGASGYIGSFLLREYRKTFPDCVGTTFSKSKPDLTPFDLCHPDLTSLRLEETGHEAVLIASAMPNIAWCEAHPKESYQLNVSGTLELVRQIASTSMMTLFLSSDYVFNGKTGGYSDTAPTSPITEYGRQKAEVERELPKLTKNYAILRLSKIYGTVWKDNTLIDGLASALLQHQTITAATDQFFSPTHVNDVVAMTLFIQQQGVKELVNLCHSEPYSRFQVASNLAKQLGVSQALVKATHLHAIPSMENRPLNTSLLCSAVLAQMQPRLMSVEDAIKQVVKNWQPVQSTLEGQIA